MFGLVSFGITNGGAACFSRNGTAHTRSGGRGGQWPSLGLLAWMLLVGTEFVSAAFRPGFVYVPATFQPGYSQQVPGRIFEVNPVTGAYRIFAEFDGVGGVPRSLAFTPDGQTLRAWHNGQIMEIRGDGQVIGSYTARTGVSTFGSANAMAFAPNGDFYVLRSGISRLRGDMPPPEVFAPGPFAAPPSIAFGPDGTLFAADGQRLYRFSNSGEQTIIDERAIAPQIGGPTLTRDYSPSRCW